MFTYDGDSMKKTTDKDINLNKLSGLRLKQCRELRKLTQEQLAEKVGFNSKYISMLENSKRNIDWDNAHKFANVLDVSADYLMGMSDIVLPHTSLPILDADITQDKLFLFYLGATGISIIFYVVNYHDTDRQEHGVSIDMFTAFSLSDYHCKYVDPFGNNHEGIIKSVAVNNSLISFGGFVFLINRIYDYVHFTFDNFQTWKNDYGDCTSGINGEIELELAKTYCGDMGKLEYDAMSANEKAKLQKEIIQQYLKDISE